MKTERYLHIPKPCHENWDAMTVVDKGKFCNSCSKEVVDFSLLTDAEVLNFFKKNTGNICGRFNTDQLQRPLQETKIQKKQGWKWLLAGITSLIMISRSIAQKKNDGSAFIGKKIKIEQPVKPVMKDTPVTIKGGKVLKKIKLKNNKTTKGFVAPMIIVDSVIKTAKEDWLTGDVVIVESGRKLKMEGYVVDEKNNPVQAVEIYTGPGILKGYTNEKGYFEITTHINADILSVMFRAPGFEEEKARIDLTEDLVELMVYMKPKVTVLPEVIVNSKQQTRCTETFGGVSIYQKVSKKDKVLTVVKKIMEPFATVEIISPHVKIFPNPVSKNSSLYFLIKETGNYQVQLFDNSSRLLLAEESTTTIKQQTINLQLPAAISSGTYYIRLLNRQTKKYYTDKLIVQ